MSDSTGKAPDTLPPLDSGLPHVAYVLLWYPLFTQPFIFREVENLRQLLPLSVYTLYGRNPRHCSREMLSSAARPKTFGMRALPGILAELARVACKRPRQLWRLFRNVIWRKWPNMETFGENIWAFLVGVSLGRVFREEGMDIVYAPWPRGTATAAWVGATLAEIPFAMAARGDNLNPADPDLGDKFENALFTRANNAADQRRMESFDHGQAKGKSFLVYNSLTLPRRSGVRRGAWGQPPQILALGRFDVTKGFDILLRACALLKQRGRDFRLTLAGGGGRVMGLGNLEETLRALRHDLNLEKEVSMPGLISHDELPGILASHDIFAAPCVIHSSGRRDGIPNTVIEALAYGLPVVSTNVNALPEVVINGQTGLAVSPGDPVALADALESMMANPEWARRMGENGASLAARMFDPGTNARSLAALFINGHAQWLEKRTKQAPCAE